MIYFSDFDAGASSALSDQWRVRFPTGNGSNSEASGAVQVFEIEMRATSGGSDQCTGGTASASSEFSGRPALNAFNNSTAAGNDWSSAIGSALDAWVQYVFPASVQVGELLLTCDASAAPPTSFILEYYDGSNWVAHYEDRGRLTWTGMETKTFDCSGSYVEPAGYKQWRIKVDTGAPSGYATLRDLQMRETSGGIDRTFGGTAAITTGGSSFSRTAAQIFNSNTAQSDSWYAGSPNNGTGHVIQFTFGHNQDITEIAAMRGDFDGCFQQYTIQYYDPDTATWVDSWQTPSGLTYSTGVYNVQTKP